MSIDSLENNISVGAQLKKLREMRNITQASLSKALALPLNTFLNYEKNSNTPPIEKLISISSFFGISCDFLILWNKSNRPRCIQFLKLAENIDKLDFNERYKIEGSLSSLVGTERIKENIDFITDETDLILGHNIAENITAFIEKKQMMRKDIANHIGVSPSQITHYENGRSLPSYEIFVKLSEFFNTSIHSIITGNKLAFNIENKGLRESVFKADQLLSLKDIDFLIHLMKRIIEDTKAA